MKCTFCKRDENEINEIFTPIIMIFKKKITELDARIKDIEEQYPLKHGFTKDNFEKVAKINVNILEIKLNAIMGNLEPFFKLDSNIEILTLYFTKYKPEINLECNLKDLMYLYIREPTRSRLDNEVKEIVIQRDSLIGKIQAIEEGNMFSEIENINDIIIPLKIFKFNNELESDIVKIIRGSSSKKKIQLCPYCSYLFNNQEKRYKGMDDNYGNLKNEDDHSSLKDWDFSR